MTTRRTALALALGVALTLSAPASETRAARECALSIGIFGISVEVCADADTNTSRERRTERDGLTTSGLDAVDANLVVGVVEPDRSDSCNIEAHNTQGEVEGGGQDVNVTMAVCTLP